MGPNGAGKTTLIRMLLGLTAATSGSMRLLGLPVPGRRVEALARVGAIVEEPRFHDHLSGRENLLIAAAARGAAAAARIDESLERVGMSRRATDTVKTYSLGMRQRLGVARCLLVDPELLILDEPMNGLDPAGIQEFRAFIHSFVEQGRTIVLSSHLLDEVEKTCDHVAIVDQGSIVVQGPIDELRGQDGTALFVVVDDSKATRELLSRNPAVAAIEAGRSDAELRVSLLDPDATTDLLRILIDSGITVRGFEPTRTSLEQVFLEVTRKLADAP